ncbi:MAG: DUF4139 domain-containing protein [Planctomycetes bacterium]|nr:DUF4139 domain-containing protein [Planctomycetota bacterium]
MKTGFIVLLGLMMVLPCAAAEKKAFEPGVALTVYNDNFAVVKERRQMDFAEGQNIVRFTDVASQIDPTSVLFECLEFPGQVKLLEQNYEYDLVNTQSLLKKYIDKPVKIQVKGSGSSGASLVSGMLLAADGPSLILQDDDGKMNVISGDSVEHIQLDKKPENLLTRPTLVWLVDSAKKLAGLCQVAYTTEGIGWRADYMAVLNDKDDALDMSGWVTITNNSGAAYQDAALKLIAGDVKRVASPQPRQPVYERVRAAGVVREEGFEEKPFMEYHLYTLDRKTTLQNNQVKQIELIEPASNVPVNKVYVYEISLWDWMAHGRSKVQVKIEFENKKENQLGIALPKGRVRVFKKDPADASLEFVGEDEIDHTPKDEKLSLYIGDAFDIAVEQKMTDARNGDRWQTFTRKVELRNRKEQAVTVFVDEKIPEGRNWKIDNSSINHQKKDAYTCRFAVPVGANQTVMLEYQMTQTW